MIMLRLLAKALLAVALIAAVVLLVLNYYPGIGKTPDRGTRRLLEEKTDKYYEGKFHNENAFRLMTGQNGRRSDRTMPQDALPVVKLTDVQRAGEREMKVTWLGHSSSLVQMGGKNILIDPVLTARTSPVSFVGPKRFSEVALRPEDVPEIDVLFLSHDHYDHMDYETIRRIDSRVSTYILPLGIDTCLRGWGIAEEKLISLDWWESVERSGVRYTLTPSQHFSGRNPLRGNSALWGGLYMDNGLHTLYYTGDGGYYDVFQRVRERLGAPELMLVEDGQYDPGWALTHMSPEEAARAGSDAGAQWAIPVHWGAFVLSNHSWDDPILRITAEAERLHVNLATPRIGETVELDRISSFTEKWWEGLE